MATLNELRSIISKLDTIGKMVIKEAGEQDADLSQQGLGSRGQAYNYARAKGWQTFVFQGKKYGTELNTRPLTAKEKQIQASQQGQTQQPQQNQAQAQTQQQNGQAQQATPTAATSSGQMQNIESPGNQQQQTTPGQENSTQLQSKIMNTIKTIQQTKGFSYARLSPQNLEQSIASMPPELKKDVMAYYRVNDDNSLTAKIKQNGGSTGQLIPLLPVGSQQQSPQAIPTAAKPGATGTASTTQRRTGGAGAAQNQNRRTPKPQEDSFGGGSSVGTVTDTGGPGDPINFPK